MHSDSTERPDDLAGDAGTATDRDPVYAEVTARTYDTHDNERRIVCIGRDTTRRGATKDAPGQATSA